MDSNEVADYLELMDLKHAYCHTIDAREYDEWVDLFTEDGEFGRAGADGNFTGHDELREFANEVFEEEYAYTAHLVCNPMFDIDGDEATGKWYLYLLYGQRDGVVGWKQAIYHDDYRKVDGEWKIASALVSYGATVSNERVQY